MAGRKRKLGPRYPNGDLKPQTGNEPVVPAIWQRIRTEAVKLAGDPRLATEIGRLSFHRELSDLQTTVALRIADIYANFEAAKQISRHARSPNYESGSRGSGNEDEIVTLERMETLDDDDPLKKRMRAALAASEAFAELQKHMRALTTPQIEMIERLCVDDRHLDKCEVWIVADLLEYLGRRFKVANSEKKARRAERRTKLLRPKAQLAPVSPKKSHETPAKDRAFALLLHALRPDLDHEGLKEARRMFGVLEDRERFRNDIKKRPPVKAAVSRQEDITSPGD